MGLLCCFSGASAVQSAAPRTEKSTALAVPAAAAAPQPSKPLFDTFKADSIPALHVPASALAIDAALHQLECGPQHGASWSERLLADLSNLGKSLGTTNTRLVVFARSAGAAASPYGAGGGAGVGGGGGGGCSVAGVFSGPSQSRAPWEHVPPVVGWTRAGPLHDLLATSTTVSSDLASAVVVNRFYDAHNGPDAASVVSHTVLSPAAAAAAEAASSAAARKADAAQVAAPPADGHGPTAGLRALTAVQPATQLQQSGTPPDSLRPHGAKGQTQAQGQQQQQQPPTTLLHLRPGDMVALPLVREGRVVAALLLAWSAAAAARVKQGQQQQGQQHQAAEGPTRGDGGGGGAGGGGSVAAVVALGYEELRGLRRLAALLGGGLFAEPSAVSYMEQVALLLAEVSAGGRSGLHDVVAAPLQRLPGMLQTRFFCTLQPLLAAVHGSQHPAVFFSRRPGVPAGGSGTAPPSALQTPVAAATLIRDASGNSNAAAAANGTSGAAVGGGPGSPFAKSSNNNSLFTALNSAAGLPAADSRAGSRKPSARDLNAPGHPQSLHQHTQLPQLGSLAVSPAGGAAGPSLAAPVGGGGSGHMNLHHHLAQLAGIQTTSTANSNQQAMHSTMDSNISALLMMSLPGMAAQGGGGGVVASRVKAVRTTLAHTLLQRALAQQRHGTASGATADDAALSGPAAAAAAAVLGAGRPPPQQQQQQQQQQGQPVTCMVVADASSQVLEEELPGRDVLLAANLVAATAAGGAAAAGGATAGGTLSNTPTGTLSGAATGIVGGGGGGGSVACLVLLVEATPRGLSLQAAMHATGAGAAAGSTPVRPHVATTTGSSSQGPRQSMHAHVSTQHGGLAGGGGSGGGGSLLSLVPTMPGVVTPGGGRGGAWSHVPVAPAPQLQPLPPPPPYQSAQNNRAPGSAAGNGVKSAAGVDLLSLSSVGAAGGGSGSVEVAPTAPLPPPLLMSAASANTAASTAAAAAMISQQLLPFRLALYLVSTEPLPSGVLEAVAAEMRGLMPLVFGVMHDVLGAGGAATCDMVSLQGQLMPRVIPAAAAAAAAALPRTVSLDLGSPHPGASSGSGLALGGGGHPAFAATSSGMAAAGRSVGGSGGGGGGGVITLRSPRSRHPPSHHYVPANGSTGVSGTMGRRGSGAGVAFNNPALGSTSRLRLASAGAGQPHGLGGGGGGGGGGINGGGLGPLQVVDPAAAAMGRAGVGDAVLELDQHGLGGLEGGGGEEEEEGEGLDGLLSSMQGEDLDMEAAMLGALGCQPFPPYSPAVAALRGSAPSLPIIMSSPLLQLEDVAGPRPLELMVSSARSRLSAVMATPATDVREESSLAVSQDLAAVDLLEVVGSGGQGVVFRGTLHGLETAIKVWEHTGRAPLEHGGEGLTGGGGALSGEGDGEGAGSGSGPGADGPSEADKAKQQQEEQLATDCIRQAKRGAMEVAVTATLSHPNIVQTYAHFSDVVVVERQPQQQQQQQHGAPPPAPPPGAAPAAPQLRLCAHDDPVFRGRKAGPLNTVLCLEYCDAGTLLSAARRGAFRLPGTGPRDGPVWPDLVPLLTSLLEVALALRYLHSRRLVHCDLKPGNVLLKSSPRDPRGWTCKLSDFGCVRLMDEQGTDGGCGFRMAQVFGTVAYLSPECFHKGRLLGAPVDVYAFGIVMWELMHCRTPYNGVDPKELPRLVVRSHLRPECHPLAPADYCALSSQCLSGTPERRPTATQLVAQLQHMLAAARAAAANQQRGGGRGALHAQHSQPLPLPPQPHPNAAAPHPHPPLHQPHHVQQQQAQPQRPLPQVPQVPGAAPHPFQQHPQRAQPRRLPSAGSVLTMHQHQPLPHHRGAPVALSPPGNSAHRQQQLQQQQQQQQQQYQQKMPLAMQPGTAAAIGSGGGGGALPGNGLSAAASGSGSGSGAAAAAAAALYAPAPAAVVRGANGTVRAHTGGGAGPAAGPGQALHPALATAFLRPGSGNAAEGHRNGTSAGGPAQHRPQQQQQQHQQPQQHQPQQQQRQAAWQANAAAVSSSSTAGDGDGAAAVAAAAAVAVDGGGGGGGGHPAAGLPRSQGEGPVSELTLRTVDAPAME